MKLILFRFLPENEGLAQRKTMSLARGVYQHIKSGKLYRVIDVARKLDQPFHYVVVYKQLYESILRGTNLKLPHGTCWVRDINEFKAKFLRKE